MKDGIKSTVLKIAFCNGGFAGCINNITFPLFLYKLFAYFLTFFPLCFTTVPRKDRRLHFIPFVATNPALCRFPLRRKERLGSFFPFAAAGLGIVPAIPDICIRQY